MKIKILKNEGMYNDQYVVNFSSEYGGAKASWNGESPILGWEYYVELEIPDIVHWRKLLSLKKNNSVLKVMEIQLL